MNEIEQAFKLLLGSGLPYSPKRDDLPAAVAAWKDLLADVPGDLLVAAAREIALQGKQFPSVAAIRKAAFARRDRWYENKDDQAMLWKRSPLRYWAEVEAETVNKPADQILAEWDALRVRTFGEIDAWREKQNARAI